LERLDGHHGAICLGCPATSASVERLFSKVGIAFSAKRKRSEAETLKNQMFANANL